MMGMPWMMRFCRRKVLRVLRRRRFMLTVGIGGTIIKDREREEEIKSVGKEMVKTKICD
jgi:hypothetical protein